MPSWFHAAHAYGSAWTWGRCLSAMGICRSWVSWCCAYMLVIVTIGSLRRLFTYPFLCAFFAWLCWEEFFDSVEGLSNWRAMRFGSRILTGHCGWWRNGACVWRYFSDLRFRRERKSKFPCVRHIFGTATGCISISNQPAKLRILITLHRYVI